MPCYHPIEAWDLTSDFDNPLAPRDISFKGPNNLYERQQWIRQGRLLSLPCRKCVGCRLSKSREWANRVVMEQLYHSESWFLTLTYDDEHLPRSFACDTSTGEIVSVHSSLVKSDLQKFFKRLRKSGQVIRYFASGEYGTHTYRPHYHILIFGLHLTDLVPLRSNFAGSQYYTSDFISRLWPVGYHILGQVTWQSASYVARYTMKKASHGYDRSLYDQASVEPEFQTMSLRPAIGRQYYDDHPEIFLYDRFSVSTPQGGRMMTLPEYFRKLYKAEYPVESFYSSRRRRLSAENAMHLKLLLTDKSYSDILSDEEEACFRRLSCLTRDDF